jgi:hypothetical protein
VAISGGGAISVNSINSHANATIAADDHADDALTLDVTATVDRGDGLSGHAGVGVGVSKNGAAAALAPRHPRIVATTNTAMLSAADSQIGRRSPAPPSPSVFIQTQPLPARSPDHGRARRGCGAANNAFSLAGSGVWTQNKIGTEVLASISGGSVSGQPGNEPDSVTVSASDTSAITATAGAAAVAVSVSGKNAVAISIGVSLAHNWIDNTVEASISNVNLRDRGIAQRLADMTITATSVAAPSPSAGSVARASRHGPVPSPRT